MMNRRHMALVRGTTGDLDRAIAMRAQPRTRQISELVALPYAPVLMHRVRIDSPSVASNSRRSTSFFRRTVLMSGISLVFLLVMMHVVAKRMRRT